jgi:8-oxo-dGTP diphosphatase
MKHYEVVAAIIMNNNKILCVQKDVNKHEYLSKKYEFPGGKVEAKETKEQALKREIKEELELDIEIKQEFLTVMHEYPDFKITMHSFICSSTTYKMILNEHIDYKWLFKHELESLDWAPADIPIVQKLKGAI